MDIQYIAFNTMIYGSIAIILSSFFSFGNILNLSLGGFLISSSYILQQGISLGRSLQPIVLGVGLFCLYLGCNRSLYYFFPNVRQRDHAGLIITLGLNSLIENITAAIYGPSSVSINQGSIGVGRIITILGIAIIGVRYFFRYTSYGTTLKAMSENENVSKSIGIKSNQIAQIYFAFLFIALFGLARLLLRQGTVKIGDGIFYLIKGIGIMILVGMGKKEYMFLCALLYVLVEYMLFIHFGLPIAYKETLILVIIVVVLLRKPEGLFTLRKRKI